VPDEPDLRPPAADPPPEREPAAAWLPTSWRERIDLLAEPPTWPPGRVAAGALAVVALVAVAVFVLRPSGGPAPEVTLPRAGSAADPATTTTTSAPAVVAHAAGAVHAPGVYRLEPGARAGDLVAAAGGAAQDADLQRLNLAAPVADGEQLYVPRIGEVAAPPAAGPTGGSSGEGGAGEGEGPVDLNSATAEELEELPGVGPAIAEAILDERERRGRFDAVEDLLDVRGIGDARLEQLRDLVTV